MMDMNTRNINAAGKPETIGTARKINSAISRLHEKCYAARQRIEALEEHLKAFSNREVAYVIVNGIPMPMSRG